MVKLGMVYDITIQCYVDYYYILIQHILIAKMGVLIFQRAAQS